MTSCRWSFFLPDTRSWSPWIWACTPLGASSRIFLAIFLAFSEEIPCTIEPVTLYTLPDTAGSPTSNALSEICRLTSLSLKTSMAALHRSSVSASIVMASSPDHFTEAPVPRKSNRVDSSLLAWLSALSTSCRSTLLTTSKDGSATSLTSRAELPSTERAYRCGGYRLSAPRTRWVRFRPVRLERTLPAGCPSGQREQTVNLSRKLRRFEPFTRHHMHERPTEQRKRASGPFSACPAVDGRLRLFEGTHRGSRRG